MKRIILAALAGMVISLPLYADDNTPSVNKREANQEKRIQQGEQSGELTAGEAARLNNREAKLQADEAAAKADGNVTPKEREKLQREENRDSRAIERKKHNANTTAPATSTQ